MTDHEAAVATRVARVLRAAAGGADAWVSTHACLRLGARLLRPAVVVSAGDPPYDGVLAAPPAVVVEVAPQQLETWLDVPDAVVWVAGRDGVVALERGRVRRVRPTTVLTARGHPWLRVPAAALTAAAT